FLLGTVLVLTAFSARSWAWQDAGPKPEEVREAIRKGVEYLKSQQRDGSWDHRFPGLLAQPGGVSALALLALLEAGVDPNDDAVRQGLAYLRGPDLQPKSTYTVALQTMVFCRAFPKDDQLLIKRNVDWLLKT